MLLWLLLATVGYSFVIPNHRRRHPYQRPISLSSSRSSASIIENEEKLITLDDIPSALAPFFAAAANATQLKEANNNSLKRALSISGNRRFSLAHSFGSTLILASSPMEQPMEC